MDSHIAQLLNSPPFNLTMSSGARYLRDEVYELCFSHRGMESLTAFVDRLREQYSRIHWEKAVYYKHQDPVLQGILRRTSTAFKSKPKKGAAPAMWERGTIASGAARRKDIDWFKLAVFDDPAFWMEMIDFPRGKLMVHPSHIDQIEPAYTEMYELITNWLVTDFNYTSLYHIYEFARDCSLTFVKECMDKVEDLRQHSTSYLRAIIESERAVQKQELDEVREVDAYSQLVIDKMKEMVSIREEIDWDKIEADAAVGEENRTEFDKVKLS